jgi:hypothetical protein
MAPDTPQTLSGHTIRVTHHNQLAPQYLVLAVTNHNHTAGKQ